jgi:hypothetical protein
MKFILCIHDRRLLCCRLSFSLQFQDPQDLLLQDPPPPRAARRLALRTIEM